MGTTSSTRWSLRGQGYEFCNCDFGCGCNFGGYPNSSDGSCRAFVGMTVADGRCGDVDLTGVKCAGVFNWPKAIHEGNGTCVFVVDESTSDAQVEALGKIFTGQLGGLPWEILGTTFSVAGVERTKITIEGEGQKSVLRAEGIGEGRGDTFKNPVTGDDHHAHVNLPDGFIWKHGECGQGTFHARAGDLDIGAERTNWILDDFDWTNA